jgi:phosphate/sulfate permease
MSTAPAPIDPRGLRFDQGAVTLALLCGFVGDWRPIAAIVALVLAAHAAFGAQYGPFLRLYAEVVEPRMPPTEEWEDPDPHRVAAGVGAAFLAAAAIAFAAGASGVGWALTLVVTVLAGLAATSGICLACELYLRRDRYVRRPQ